MKSVTTLGKLVSIEIKDGKKMSFRNKWLCWDGRNLLIATVKSGKAKAKLDSKSAARHKRFHGESSVGAMLGDIPDKVGKVTEVGLVEALTYTVPRKIKSPEKNPYHWHHAFGDTGHRGGKYPDKVMPMLVKDEAGNLFIQRRKGNIYRVDSWIRG